MKTGVLTAFLLMIFIGFASAQGLSGILSSIDETTLVLYAVFIVSFSILFFSLSAVFKGNKSIAGVISAVISVLLVYFVNKTGFDVQGLFYNIGISQETLATIVPIVILIGAIFIIIKLKSASPIVFGGLFIVGSFFITEQLLFIIVGIILLLVGFFLVSKKNKNKK